jgi:hypothetical protein
MGIIASKDGGKFKKIESTNFALEEKLQKLIHEDEIMKKIKLGPDEDLTLLTLAREFSTTSGPADVIAIDTEGNIYIIETKLKKNSDRREILAQIIDYAGAMWDEFRDFNKFEEKLKDNPSFSAKSLSELIRNSDFEIRSDLDIDKIIEKIKQNFEHGSFKFVTVWDKLESKLINAIRYLNEKSHLTVYAVTFEYYKDAGLEILIPSVYGREAEKRSVVEGKRMKWTIDTIHEEFKKNLTSNEYSAFEKLEQFLNENAYEIRIGSGAHGSIGPVFKKLCPDDEPRSFLTLYGDGQMVINYAWLKAEYRNEIAKKFSENPDLKIDFNADLAKAYPRYTRDQWSQNIDNIISVIRVFL